MTEGGLEILTQRNDVDPGQPEILERLKDLLAGLAQTQHETRFGVERCLGPFLGSFRTARDRSYVARCRTSGVRRRTVSTLWL